MSELEAYLSTHRDRHLDELFDLLRIPSVSTDPAYRDDVARGAAFMKERMQEAGLSVEVVATSGHPIVYGTWLNAPGAPTVLIYGHYDVQPPEPLDEWRNPPFEPTLEDGNIVARGATDDKGQMYCHIKAIEAHMRVHGRLPVNVHVIIEGEEEVGSPSLEPFLRARRDALACDLALVSDTPMFGPGRPSITYGLRGITYVEIVVTGPSHDLHSGLYGGGVVNPANALARIVASFHDADGRVAIDGFYDAVQPLSEAERQDMRDLGHDEDAFRREVGVEVSSGEPGYSVIERTTSRPTLDVNGIWSGYTGEGAKTVLPSKASAKVSCRLVPDQTPDAIEAMLRAHIARVCPPGVTVQVRGHHGTAPCVVPRDGAHVQAVSRALERVWGCPAVFTRGGGSIPIVSSFREILGVDTILMGLGLEDDRLHSPNEKFGVENFVQGIRACAFALEELAK